MTVVSMQLLLVLGLIGAAVASQARGQCEDATDGMYSYGNCSEAFFACSGGHSIEMYSPAGLYFDETRHLCDYSDAVAECEANGSGSGEEGETPKGRDIEMFCPAGLSFDGTRTLCDYSSAVAECDAGEGSGSGDEEESVSGSGEDQEVSEIVLEQSEASGSSEISTGSGEGSGSLIDKSGDGSGTLNEASANIEQSKGCGIVASVEENGSGHSELLNGSTSEDQLLSTPEALSPMLSYCAIHGDGFHSFGCTTMMISCRNGFARRLFCPKPTVWDEKRSVCNYRQDVDGCPAAAADIEEAKDLGSETFACQREGIFSDSSCTDQFVLCTYGKGYRLSCDVGLLYSRIDENCIPATELDECKAEHNDD